MFQLVASVLCPFDCRPNFLSDRSRRAERSFTLSVLVHGAALDGGGSRILGLIKKQTPPCIGVAIVGDENEHVEVGEWCEARGQWRFQKAITLKVKPDDELSVVISCPSVFASDSSAELWLPVSEVLPRLRVDDRAGEGLMYATPVTSFDLPESAGIAGRVFLSFETKTHWAMCRNDDDSLATLKGSELRWAGSVEWKPEHVVENVIVNLGEA